jgi:hypothetical protein
MSFEDFLEEKGIPFKKQGEDIWVEDHHLAPHMEEIKKLFPEVSIDIETTFYGTEEELEILFKEFKDMGISTDGIEVIKLDYKSIDDLEDLVEYLDVDDLDDLFDSDEWEDEDWEEYWSEDDEPGSDTDK